MNGSCCVFITAEWYSSESTPLTEDLRVSSAFTYRMELPVISLYRWNYVWVHLYSAKSYQGAIYIEFIIIIITAHCFLLYHLILFYYCKSSAAWTRRFTVMIINFSFIIHWKDNTHLQPVVAWSCCLDFNVAYFIIYLKVYLSPLGCVGCLSSFIICINLLLGYKEPRWENKPSL